MTDEFHLETDSPSHYRKIFDTYRYYWADPEYRKSILLSAFTFAASLLGVFFASRYASNRASNYVTDIVLSNIPVFNIDDTFVYGTFALIVFTVYLCFIEPRRIPFILYSLAIFYSIRAVFISLTHLGPFPVQAESDFGSVITRLFFGGDYFFSGHTGTPFLLALIFWRDRIIRYLYLAWTLFFSVVVLLAHLHYTIDVLSALFITYAIRDIVRALFLREHSLFLSDSFNA